MFEIVIKKVLNELVGKYVDNINAKDLRINVLNGNINLANLNLKTTAFDEFDLPVELTKGHIGQLQAKVPWDKLQKSPVIVNLSDVLLLVKPKKNVPWDEEREQTKQNIVKSKKLKAFETKRKAHEKQQKESMKKPKRSLKEIFTGSATKKIIEAVLNNIQITVSRVHVRYEDFSDEGNPISFGLSLNGLRLHSCNERWEEALVRGTAQTMYKQIILNSATIYSTKGIIQMQHFVESMLNDKEDRVHLLHPLNGTVNFEMQMGQVDFAKPRIQTSIHLDPIIFSLDNRQYRNALNTAFYMLHWRRFEGVRSLKPAVSLSLQSHTSRDACWNYTMSSVRRIIRKQFTTWQDIVKRNSDRKEYMLLYKRKRKVPWLPPLKANEKARMLHIEELYNIEDLLLMRTWATNEVDFEIKKQKHVAHLKRHATAEEKKRRSKQDWASMMKLTDADRRELYQSVGYIEVNSDAADQAIPSNFVELVLNFSCPYAKICLLDSPSAPIVDAQIFDISTGITIQHDLSGAVKAGLDSIVLVDRCKEDSHFPLASRAKDMQEMHKPLVAVEVMLKPEKHVDLRLKGQLQSVNIVIPNVEFLQLVVGFIITPPGGRDTDFEAFFRAAKNRATTTLRDSTNVAREKIATASQKIVDIDLALESPTVALLQGKSVRSSTDPAIIIDLGSVSIKRKDQPLLVNLQEEEHKYESFNVEIFDFKAFLGTVNDLDTRTEGNGLMLVDNVSTNISISRRIRQSLCAELFRLGVDIPPLHIHMCPDRVRNLRDILLTYQPFLEDPTGRISRSKNVKQQKMFVDFGKKLPYSVELRQDGRILLFDGGNDNDGTERPKAIIHLSHAQLTTEDNCFIVILPKHGSDPQEIRFFEGDIDTWVSSIRQVILSNISLMPSSLSSEDLKRSTTDKNDEENSLESTTSPSNQSLALTSITFRGLFLHVEQQKQPIFELKIDSLDISVSSRQMDHKVNVSLGTFGVSDLWTMKGKQRKMITGSDESTLSIVFAKQGSPLYRKDALISIDCEMDRIEASFDQGIASRAITLFVEMVEVLETLRPPPLSFAAILDESTLDQSLRVMKKLTFAVSGSLGSASLLLFDKNLKWISASASHAALNITSRDSTAIVEIMVNSVAVHELIDELEIFKCGSDKSEDMRFLQVRLSLPLASSTVNTDFAFAKEVSVKISNIQVLVFAKIFRQMQMYLTQGEMWIFQFQGKAQYSLQYLFKKILAPSRKKTRVHVLISNCSAILPVSRENTSRMFKFCMGSLSLENALDVLKGKWVQKYQLAVKGISATSEIGESSVALDTMMSIEHVDMAMSQLLRIPGLAQTQADTQEASEGTPKLSGEVNISPVYGSISHMQYQMLWLLLETSKSDLTSLKNTISTSDVSRSMKFANEFKDSLASEGEKASVAMDQIAVDKGHILKEFRFNLHEIEWVLLRGRSKEKDPISKVILRDVSLSLIERAGNKIECEAAMGDLTAINLRNQKQETFLSISEMMQVSCFVNPHLIKLSIRVGGPQFIIPLDLMIEIANTLRKRLPSSYHRSVHHSPVHFGDKLSKNNLCVITDEVYLSKHLVLTKKHILYIEHNPTGVVTLNGQGNTLHLASSVEEEERVLIHIADGMELMLSNIVIICEDPSTLHKHVNLGRDANIIYPSVNNVMIRKNTINNRTKGSADPTEQKAETQISTDSLHDKKTNTTSRAIMISAQFGSPTMRLPVIDRLGGKAFLSLSLALKADYFHRDDKDSGALRLEQVRMQVENAKGEARFPVIEDLGLHVGMLTSDLHAVVQNREIDITLHNSFGFRLSFDEVHLLSKLFEGIKEQIAFEKKREFEDYFENSMLRLVSSSFSLGSSDVTEMSDTSFADTDTEVDIASVGDLKEFENEEPGLEKTRSFDMMLTVSFATKKSVSLEIVDTSRGFDYPLFLINLHDISIGPTSFVLSSKAIELHLQALLIASYFREDLSEWEPLIEGCAAIATFSRQGQSPPIHSLDISILSEFEEEDQDRASENAEWDILKTKKALNVNITWRMLQVLISTLRHWAREMNEIPLNSIQKHAPFTLINHSGHDIQVEFVGSSTRRTIDSGAEHEFSLREHSNNATINLSICGMHAKDIHVDEDGQVHLADKESKKLVLVKVETRENRKIIMIRSGIVVENKSSIAWQIGLKMGRDTNDVSCIGTVQPHDFIGLPVLNDLLAYSICVKPIVSSEEFSWNTNGLGLNLLTLVKQTRQTSFVMECESKSDNGQTYFCVGTVSSYAPIDPLYKKKLKKFGRLFLIQNLDYLITIRTPLVIENLLGLPADVELLEKSSLQEGPRDIWSSPIDTGQRLNVYTVNPKSNVMLRIHVKSEYQRWHCRDTALIHTGLNRLQTLTKKLGCTVHDGNTEITTDVHLDHIYMSKSAFVEVLVYVPFWLFNNIRHPLWIRSVEGKDRKLPSDIDSEPFLFSLGRDGVKASIHLSAPSPSRKASEPISMMDIGISKEISLEDGHQTYDVGVKITPAPGRFKRTLMVSFEPRYIIFNKTGMTLDIGHTITVDQKPKGPAKVHNISSIEDGDYLYWKWACTDMTEKSSRNIVLRTWDTLSSFEWSVPMNVNVVGEFPLKLASSGENKAVNMLLKMDIRQSNAKAYVVVEKLEHPPFLIYNHLHRNVEISQEQCETWWTVPRRQAFPYCFDNINAPHKLRLKLPGDNVTRTISMNEIGKCMKISLRSDKRAIFLWVALKRSKCILHLSHRNMNQDQQQEQQPENPTAIYNFNVFLSGAAISVVDNLFREVCFVSIDPVHLSFVLLDNKDLVARFSVTGIQIDNQAFDAPHSVVLCHNRPVEVNTENAFLDIDFTLSLGNTNMNLIWIENISFLVQQFDINVDTQFAIAVISYLLPLLKLATSEEENDQRMMTLRIQQIMKDPTPPKQNLTNVKVYIREMSIHPVHVILTFRFMKNSLPPEWKSNEDLRFLNWLLDFVSAVTSIDRSSFTLNALIVPNVYDGIDRLRDRMVKHYKNAVLRQVYKVIGSLDAIGNPISLFNDIGTGVRDLFYEPTKALVHRPHTVGLGLAKGGASMATRTAKGITNSASKITGTLSSAVDYLTFDDEYMYQKQVSRNHKISNPVEGFLSGAGGLAMGVFGGVTGVVMQPVKGVTNQGLGGFFKGLGRGIVGVAAKPVSGAIDLVSKTAGGFSETANTLSRSSSTTVNPRRRFARAFAEGDRLVPYSFEAAWVQFILDTATEQRRKYLVPGQPITERCRYYCASAGCGTVCLTDKSLICLNFESRSVNWTTAIDDIISCELDKKKKNTLLLACAVGDTQIPINRQIVHSSPSRDSMPKALQLLHRQIRARMEEKSKRKALLKLM